MARITTHKILRLAGLLGLTAGLLLAAPPSGQAHRGFGGGGFHGGGFHGGGHFGGLRRH